MYRVVRTFTMKGYDSELEKKTLGKKIEIVEIASPTEADLIENCKDADAVICAYEPFTAIVIDSLPNLKLINFKTVAYNTADFDYAKTKGIPVSHISKWNTKDVAEYCVGMILSLNKRIFKFNSSTHFDKVWDYTMCPEIRRLESQTVGLLGFGNIPKLITERLKPFGCRVIAYDPYVDPEKAFEDYGVQINSLDEVLEQSDILSIHLPVTDATTRIINQDTIAKMKDGAMLINSARGLVVDEEALIKAVDTGKISYAGIDVVDSEYPDMNDHPFAKRDNIILTPHVAFYSQEAMSDGIFESAMNVKNFFDGNFSEVQIVNNVKFD